MWNRAVPPEWTQSEADFLAAELDRVKPGPVLDLPCGTGRHAAALAARGFQVTGVDLSIESIEQARARPEPVDWRVGDMRRFTARGEFAGAYTMGNSFAYFDHEGCREFIAAVAAALRPGALFILETGAAAESLLRNFQESREIPLGDDFVFSSKSRYVAGESRLEVDYTFTKNGVAETRPAQYFVHTCAEIKRMLTAAGFDVEAAYGSVQREPFTLSSRHLILVSRRRD